jgi:hypothetical protein
MPKKPKVYIETSIISYYAGNPSRDLIILAHQHLTTMWWEKALPNVEPYISEFVRAEIIKGDQTASKKRLEASKLFPVLGTSPELESLAEDYFIKLKIPEAAKLDAYHIACATIFQLDYLLTWNCTHIANATLKRQIEKINESFGFETPVICTPEELLEV